MTRLDFEKEEMRRLYPQFSFFSGNGKSGWKGNLKGYQFQIICPSGYPTASPEVYDSPLINTLHRFEDNRLCLWRSEEWKADWTVATVVTIILRFLDDYSKGKV